MFWKLEKWFSLQKCMSFILNLKRNSKHYFWKLEKLLKCPRIHKILIQENQDCKVKISWLRISSPGNQIKTRTFVAFLVSRNCATNFTWSLVFILVFEIYLVIPPPRSVHGRGSNVYLNSRSWVMTKFLLIMTSFF